MGLFDFLKNINNNDKKNIQEKNNEGIKPSKSFITLSETEIQKDKPKPKRLYELPRPLASFLNDSRYKSSSINKTSADVKAGIIEDFLRKHFITSSLLNIYIGPHHTTLEIKIDASINTRSVSRLSSNMQNVIAAKELIVSDVPERSNTVYITFSNIEPLEVKLIDVINPVIKCSDNELLVSVGKDVLGKQIIGNLREMPHVLIGGTTGSGKSTLLHSFIMSLLLTKKPNELKLILIDPKKVEFNIYQDIPHLLCPVINDVSIATNVFKELAKIVSERYDIFAKVGARNIDEYNYAVKAHNTRNNSNIEIMPYIVVFVDLFADIMKFSGEAVEDYIQRISELSRGCGVHLVLAVQRPSSDVITGNIKANIPSRISFSVASGLDSRIILDQSGAEDLCITGEMLYLPYGTKTPTKVYGPNVSIDEIRKVCNYTKQEQTPKYETRLYKKFNRDSAISDSLYDDVVEFVRVQQKASTSLLQRRFGIGYNRAARLIDTLEDEGVIGPANGMYPRDVLIK